MPQSSIVPGRSCTDCTLCCKVMAIAELAKPRNQECPNCAVNKGCKIYADRPHSCAAFDCTYLTNASLREYWKPSQSRMVLVSQPNRLFVLVDSDTPDAWREQPYYADLKRWAAALAPQNIEVAVIVADRTLFIRPDRDAISGQQASEKWLKMVWRNDAGIGGEVDLIDQDGSPHHSDR